MRPASGNERTADHLRDISVVMLSYNRCDELRTTLLPLCRMAVSDGFELIVVDNASSDGSVELLQDIAREFPNVICVFNNANTGVGRGRNEGWQRSSREFIVSLDDDARVSRADLVALRSHAVKLASAGLIFPQVIDLSSGQPMIGDTEDRSACETFHGACHIVRQAAISDVGYLDEQCAFGGEELDYSIRLRSGGWDVVFAPDLQVIHNGLVRDASADQWRRLEWIRNHVRVYFKHFPPLSAAKMAGQFLPSQIAWGVRVHGPTFGVRGLLAGGLGLIQGRSVHRRAPHQVVELYRRIRSAERPRTSLRKRLVRFARP